jgi:hypothetical protein
MIFHASIEADDPARVASALARLWRAEAFPFPPVADGSLIVLAGDHRNSAIEVYPRGTTLYPTDGDPVARPAPDSPRHGAVHLAIATPLAAEEVFGLAAEYGWLAQARTRGGMFEVIELWIEGGFLVEVLTPEMQGQYLGAMTQDGWRAALAAGPVPA